MQFLQAFFRSLLLALLAASGVYVALLWREGHDFRREPTRTVIVGQVGNEATSVAPATATAPAPAPAASDPAALPPPTETVETLDPAPPLKPTLSLGRQAGLNRVKDGLGLNASAAMAVDQDSGEVVFAKNPEAVLPIASLTKLMTAVVLSDAKVKWDDPVTIAEEDVDRERNSRSRLRVGTTLTRSEALHLALMSSENRAAHALARTFPGGLEAFVQAMNAKARALGMKNTTFVDPTGLSVRNQSTARDVALLAAAAAKDPMIREYSTTPELQFVAGKRSLRYLNSNRLVRGSDWDIQLQKTGYIVEAGHCVAMQARIDGKRVMLVVLDAGDKRSRGADSERLRKWVASHDAPAKHAATSRPAKS